LAVGEGVCALRSGRHVVRAAALLAACGLCHLLSGYVAAGSLVLAALVTPSWLTWRRLGLVAGLAATASAYHWTGIVIDGAAMNPSVVQRATLPLKFTSLGHLFILGQLCTGGLFDHGRLPTLTLLVALGVAVAVGRRRQPLARTLLVLGGAWLALYFGRPTWGGLLDWLPFGSQIHMHRFIIGVHLAGAWLAGLAGGILLRWALAAPAPWWRTAACAALALLPLPAHRERAVTLGRFHRWQQETADAWRTQGADVEGALATIATLPPGRVFAGLPTTWGARYTVGHQPIYAAATQAGLDTLGYLYHDFSYTGDLFPEFNDVHRAQYELFNVRYVLVPAGTPIPEWYTLRGQFGAQALYEIATPGYCSLVDSDLDAHGPPIAWYAGATAWARTGAVDFAQHPRMHIGAAVAPNSVPFARLGAEALQPLLVERPARGRVLTELVAPGTYAADVDAARACWLMCRVSWHPNWHATVDGLPVTPTMLAPAYLGVPVTPGRHHIQFTYVPRWYRKWLLLLGLASLAGAAWWRRRQRATLTAPAQPVPSGPTEHP